VQPASTATANVKKSLTVNMPIDLYYTVHSPSCRPVLLVAKAVGVELNLIELSVKGNEHKTEELIKVSTVHESSVQFKSFPHS
jgi:hypothetical protein